MISASTAACLSNCAPSRATFSEISVSPLSWANSSSMWPRMRSVGILDVARAWVLPLDDLAVLKGTYARLLIYTGSWTRPCR